MESGFTRADETAKRFRLIAIRSRVRLAGLALLAAVLAAAGGGPACAQSLESLGFRPFFAEPSRSMKIQLRAVVRPQDALPDGRPAVASRGSGGRIAEAWLIAPTGRYDHGVLGDAVEAGGLMVRLRDGGERRLLLPENQVFEDLQPRLADLDGDGAEEILVVRSSLDAGAVLAVYGLAGDELKLIAEGPQRLPRHRSLRVLRYRDGEIALLGRDFYDAQIIGDFRLEDLDGNGMDEVIFQLDDGLEVRLYR